MIAAGALVERVETVVTPGLPDVHGLFNKIAFWAELKATVEPPARAGTPLLGRAKGLRAEQINWHIEYNAYGGRSWVLVGLGSRTTFIVSGRHAIDINLWSLGDFGDRATDIVERPSQWAVALRRMTE
jgi:hypothetical protein